MKDGTKGGGGGLTEFSRGPKHVLGGLTNENCNEPAEA